MLVFFSIIFHLVLSFRALQNRHRMLPRKNDLDFYPLSPGVNLSLRSRTVESQVAGTGSASGRIQALMDANKI